jgi:hypothetical protein
MMSKQRQSRPGPVPPPEDLRDWQIDENKRPARPRFTIWRAFGILIAIIAANMLLSLIFGAHAVTCFLTIPAGLALYEVWYVTFETVV